MYKKTKIMIVGSLAAALVISGGVAFSNQGIENVSAAAAVTTSVKSEKTRSEIAQEKGIDVQKLIDLEAAGINLKLDTQLAEGIITQEEYDNKKADVMTMATEHVNSSPTMYE